MREERAAAHTAAQFVTMGIVERANKRIQGLIKAGLNTPALQSALKATGGTGVFTAEQTKQAKHFTTLKTSSVKGAKQSRRERAAKQSTGALQRVKESSARAKANKRAAELERRGLDTPAYKAAKAKLEILRGEPVDKVRFTADEQAIAQQFNKQITSTVTGLRDVLKLKQDTIRRKYNITDKQISDLYQIINDGEIKKLMTLPESDIVFKALSDGVKGGLSLEDLKQYAAKSSSAAEINRYIDDEIIKRSKDGGEDDDTDFYMTPEGFVRR